MTSLSLLGLVLMVVIVFTSLAEGQHEGPQFQENQMGGGQPENQMEEGGHGKPVSDTITEEEAQRLKSASERGKTRWLDEHVECHINSQDVVDGIMILMEFDGKSVEEIIASTVKSSHEYVDFLVKEINLIGDKICNLKEKLICVNGTCERCGNVTEEAKSIDPVLEKACQSVKAVASGEGPEGGNGTVGGASGVGDRNGSEGFGTTGSLKILVCLFFFLRLGCVLLG